MANQNSTATPVRTYKLGGRAMKLYRGLKTNFGTDAQITKADIISLGEKQKNDEGYISYIIGSMRKKGFLNMKGGKFVLGNGTVPVTKIARRKANA